MHIPVIYYGHSISPTLSPTLWLVVVTKGLDMYMLVAVHSESWKECGLLGSELFL